MNTGQIDLSRCLTMAAYSAFVALRNYLKTHPHIDVNTSIETIRRVNSDMAGLDYVGGLAIHSFVSPEINWENNLEGFRLVVGELIKATNPWWVSLAPYGREKVRSVLAQDQVQCLRVAGLFDPIPEREVINWWDKISSEVRAESEMKKVLRGREAERLSLAYEHERINRLDLNLTPEWVSLDDNSLGYDIKSYDIIKGQIVSRLIEVKSAHSNIIYITRNEWNNAVTAGDYYFFQIWKMPEAKMHEISVSYMKQHIPIDQGNGQWQNVQIEI